MKKMFGILKPEVIKRNTPLGYDVTNDVYRFCIFLRVDN